MNLRQKVKKAKEELNALENTYCGNTAWDIVKNHEEKSKLKKVINYKRNINEYYNWNEKHVIDWERLTYISFYANFENLGTLKSANGKPLTQKEVNRFLTEIFKTKFYNFANQISKVEPSNIERKYIDYCLVVSNDRTKAKKLHVEKIYYQFKGDDKIYSYKKED